MRKYIGLDVGQKTIGISYSNSGIIANNLETYRFNDDNYEIAFDYINKLIKTNNIDVVVIGLPKHMNNDLGIRANISIDCKENILKENPNVEVVLYDERLSTKEVINTLVNANVTRKKQKMIKDELSAVIILQNYLDSINK